MLVEEEETLETLAKTWSLAVAGDARAALLRYSRLLLDWNGRINLTGSKSFAELVDDHFPDAFAVAATVKNAVSVVDVGSGGGLPGLPVAILAPQIRLLLLEPIHKKVAFLRMAVRELGLSGRVEVAARRLEAGLPAGRTNGFDLAMSRAAFHPDEWLRRGRSLVRREGRILALSSVDSITVPEGLHLEESVCYAAGRRWLLSFGLSSEMFHVKRSQH